LAGTEFWIALAAGAACCFAGSVVWHLDAAPGGRWFTWLTPMPLIACLILGGQASRGDEAESAWRIADDLASAAVLGSATTAMLMGHSYLIAPAMSIAPLMRLLLALAGSLAIRIGFACVALWLWRTHSSPLETDTMLWLPVRWLLGLLGPLVLGWMAWET